MGRRKKISNYYFDEKEENALINYIKTDKIELKHELYNKFLRKPFTIMVESIIRRYSTHIGDYNIEDVEADAHSHLVENMIKYKPYIIEYKKKNSDKWRKSKDLKFLNKKDADDKLDELLLDKFSDYEYRMIESSGFSYCQAIVRNFYRDHSRNTYKEKHEILSWDDYSDDILHRNEYLYELEDMEEENELAMLINNVIDAMRNRIDTDATLKKNEIIVGEGIIEVLKYWHILFLEETPDGNIKNKVTNKYEKNKILSLLNEYTRLSTKEIRNSMKPYREIYYLEKSLFYDDDDL